MAPSDNNALSARGTAGGKAPGVSSGGHPAHMSQPNRVGHRISPRSLAGHERLPVKAEPRREYKPLYDRLIVWKVIDNMAVNLYLETERLIIREHNESDLNQLYRLKSDCLVTKYVDYRHSSLDDTKKYLGVLTDNRHCIPRKQYRMAISLKENLVYIGMVDLSIETDFITNGRAELSYYLLPDYWGNGFAIESAKALIKYGFDTLRLHKIMAGCLKTNTSSERVMIACGMAKEAEFREHAKYRGLWVNRLEYGILSKDVRT